MIRRLGAAVALVATPGFAQEPVSDGQLAFNNHCRTCHSLEAGDNRLGPTLHDLMGREAGTVEGYAFSNALVSSGIVWNAETLASFIENPDAVVRGNAMKPYGGIVDTAVRDAIVAYLSES